MADGSRRWGAVRACAGAKRTIPRALPPSHEKPNADPAALCTALAIDVFIPERATRPATPELMRERTSCLQRT